MHQDPKLGSVAAWCGALAIVSTLHAGAAFAILWQAPEPLTESRTGGAMIVELSSVTASPDVERTDIAVGPRSDEVAAIMPSTAQVAATTAVTEEVPPVPVVEDASPDVAVPKPVETKPAKEPPKEEVREARKKKAQNATAVMPTRAAAAQPIDNATAVAETVRGRQVGLARIDRAAIRNWQRELVVHLNKHKRYPQNAGRATGTVLIGFVIDRQGRLLRHAVARSSGIDPLDAAALQVVRRSAPFPKPPDSMAGSTFSFRIPVRFKSSGR